MSYNSYAYDPQGNKHQTYVKNGQTYTSGGDRLGAGWTSQTAGGVYKMGSDGVGVKVNNHNTPSSSSGRTSYGSLSPEYQGTKTSNNSSLNSVGGNAISGRNNSSGTSNNIYDEYTHVTMKLPNGTTTTVSKGQADMYADMGYEIGSPTMGASSWRKEEGIRNDTAGSDWVDNGYNDGNIYMRDGNGNLVGVNARYSDSYFEKGYTLDAKSQSINRALQSEYHGTYDRINDSIQDGSYSGYNSDYSKPGTRDERGYLFNGLDKKDQFQFGNSINRALGKEVSPTPNVYDSQKNLSPDSNIVKEIQLPNGSIASKTLDGSYLVNNGGEKIKMSEDEYTNYMLENLGFGTIEFNPKKEEKKTDSIAIKNTESHSETLSAESKAIEAKLQAEKGNAVKTNPTKINSFIDSAKSMIGFSYSQSNRMGSNSADCSSLVGRAMKMAGITDNAFVTTQSMITDNRFEKISKSEAKPGDIMWQKGHVGIKLDGGKVLEASSSKNQVREANLGNRFTHAYRIKEII